MKVAYIGPFTGQPDEGMRHLSRIIPDGIGARWPVLRLDTRSAMTPAAFMAVRRFDPDVIHYLSGPTIRSLAVLKLYRSLIPGSVAIASAPRPYLGRSRRASLALLRPHVVLTQDPRWEAEFRSAGIRTCFLPNGVDINRFRPLANDRRVALRSQYGLPADATIVLHVGHLKASRNLDLLIDLQRQGPAQVVVVGSAGREREAGVAERLRAAGCLVLDAYQPNVEHLYACADLYLFPVLPATGLPTTYNQVGAIDMPLSVLEAMATDLPVVTTRMPALERLFEADAAFKWFDGTAEDAVRQLRLVSRQAGGNRQKVARIDSESMLEKLEAIYDETLSSRRPRAS